MKIIVIEDNANPDNLLVEQLEASGYVATGFPSVEAYEREDLLGDIYLFDLNLPGEDSLSFAARLRATAPHVGVVVLSVCAGSAARAQSYDAGADIFLDKPCDSREIIAAIKSIARRILPTMPVQRSLTLFPERFLLKGPDGETQVTASEVALLQALATSPDRLLSYEEIMSLLGARKAPLLATLEVRITRLRKKIAATMVQERTIVSVRKVGYRLTMPLKVGHDAAD